MNFAGIISTQKRAVLVVVLLVCVLGIYAAFQSADGDFSEHGFSAHRDHRRKRRRSRRSDARHRHAADRRSDERHSGHRAHKIDDGARLGRNQSYFSIGTLTCRQTLALVQTRVSQINLPPTAQIRRVDRLTFAVFPVAGYSLTSETRDRGEFARTGDLHDSPASGAAFGRG